MEGGQINMEKFGRSFSTREKVLLLILTILLLGLGYYYFVDQPVRNAIQSANIERDTSQVELDALNIKLFNLRKMENELNNIEQGVYHSSMKSYNNVKSEIALLNDLLESSEDYSVSFAEVTRDGNQIRRPVSLQFSTSSYYTATSILSKLYASEDRCLIQDVRISSKSGNTTNLKNDAVSVAATVIFYETLVGGIEDAGLPQGQ